MVSESVTVCADAFSAVNETLLGLAVSAPSAGVGVAAGAVEGALVGDVEGEGDGDVDGDGFADGATVGDVVGTVLGAAVGAAVGLFVGVGAAVGLAVGLGLGSGAVDVLGKGTGALPTDDPPPPQATHVTARTPREPKRTGNFNFAS